MSYPTTNEFALFVKPWPQLALPQLALHVLQLGFRWIELPVRPGFPVEPDQIEEALPAAVKLLADLGVGVVNVTAALPLDDERLYAACAASGIRMNRVIFPRSDPSYWQSEAAARRQLEQALPLCAQYGLQIGVQHHYGASVPINSMGLHHLVEEYDPRYVGAIWDPAHNGLQGEDPQTGLEMVQSHLCMVNLKNAVWRRVSAPSAAETRFAPYFCLGRHGQTSWRAVAAAVKAVGYTGPLTFSAEYSDAVYTDRFLVEDLAFARELFARELSDPDTAAT
jgi:sugar phosphate isomerase/epimerase